MEYRIGCSGWSYSTWAGHFYPEKMDAREYLAYYSKVFDTVEIDSSFYAIPNVFTTGKWAKLTPDNFRFTAKFPSTLTHDRRLAEPEKDLGVWYQSFLPLKEKITAFLIQLPPSLTYREGYKKLKYLVGELDHSYRYAIEFRHSSWLLEGSVSDLLAAHKICWVWSVRNEFVPSELVTTDFLYLRFIGDRSIDEKDFGTVQRDRNNETILWTRKLKQLEQEKALAIIVANNHFAGFGPYSANSVRTALGLEQAVWEEMKQAKLG